MTHTINENEIAIPADIKARLMSGERIKFGGKASPRPSPKEREMLPMSGETGRGAESAEPTQEEIFAMRRYAAQYRVDHPSATDAQVSKAVRKQFNVKLK